MMSQQVLRKVPVKPSGRRFVPWHVVDCVFDFLFCERFIKCCHVVLLDAQKVLVEVYMSGWWAPHGL